MVKPAGAAALSIWSIQVCASKISQSSSAYIGAVLGAGILAMPLALSRMGILLGTIIMLWAGLTASFGLYLQTRCARYLDRGSASFSALSQITYPNAAVIFDTAIAIKCFGVGVSYLIIIGNLMPDVVRGFSENAGGVGFLVDRQFWITGFMWALLMTRTCCVEPWLTNPYQAYPNTLFIPAASGLSQIHKCGGTNISCVPAYTSPLSFHQRRYQAG